MEPIAKAIALVFVIFASLVITVVIFTQVLIDDLKNKGGMNE